MMMKKETVRMAIPSTITQGLRIMMMTEKKKKKPVVMTVKVAITPIVHLVLASSQMTTNTMHSRPLLRLRRLSQRSLVVVMRLQATHRRRGGWRRLVAVLRLLLPPLLKRAQRRGVATMRTRKRSSQLPIPGMVSCYLSNSVSHLCYLFLIYFVSILFQVKALSLGQLENPIKPTESVQIPRAISKEIVLPHTAYNVLRRKFLVSLQKRNPHAILMVAQRHLPKRATAIDVSLKESPKRPFANVRGKRLPRWKNLSPPARDSSILPSTTLKLSFSSNSLPPLPPCVKSYMLAQLTF